MNKTTAKTPAEYIKQLPPDRAKMVKAVRKVIKDNLPKGYVEVIRWGMITYEVPLKRYPVTYNKEPLMFAGIANQKNHVGIYLMCAYGHKDTSDSIEKAFKKAGKKLDMGKSCVRMKKLEDFPLEIIGETIKKFSVDEFIKLYESSRGSK